MSRPIRTLLPRSGVGVEGPWLVIEPAGQALIRIDLRQLDDVALLDRDSDDDDNAADAKAANELTPDERERRSSIVLSLGDLEIALYITDGRPAARQIVREAEVWVDGGTEESNVESAEAASSNAALDAKFVILSSLHPDDAAGKEDRLSGTVFDLIWPQASIGRTNENSIVIDHRSVSRTHARLTRDGETGRYTIHEVSPTANGVRVNGKDVTAVELAHRDIVDLGHVRMRYIQTDAGRWPQGPPVPERFVLVDGVSVLFDGQFIRIGTQCFRVNEVSEYALRGANIPLLKGGLVQAALTLLVAVAAGWEVPTLAWFGITMDRDEPRVNDVEPDSQGAAAGVRAGDEVRGFGGVSTMLYPEIGDHLVLKLRRDGEQIHITLRPEESDDLPEMLNRNAPPFVATTHRGEQISLAEFAGHIVLLYFWHANDDVSQPNLAQLSALHAKYRDLRIVALLSDTGVADAQNHAPEYAFVHDEDESISDTYEAAPPTLAVVDREGVVRKLESGSPDFQRLEAELISLMKPALAEE